MMDLLLKIFKGYIQGYVNIKVESYYLERFINICINQKIFLWNINRKKSSILYSNISIKDYKKIRKIAKKTKSRVKIESKKGVPFILYKYRKRKAFLIFLALILVLLLVFSNYVWNIEIIGNENISREEIITELTKDGLSVGKFKKSINTDLIINRVRLNRDDIAWMGINIKGTNVLVEIKEIEKAPQVINPDEYCNIKSEKTGTISKINVQNGTASVKEGDSVKAGDILVWGYMEGKYTGIRYVHAQANIEAKILHSKKEKFYYKDKIKVPTGATEHKYSININNFKIIFYKTLSKFKNYDTIEEIKKIKIFSNFYLPIEITKKTNYEYQNKDITYTEEELKESGITKLENELLHEIENKENILNKQVNTYGGDGFIEVEVIYEVLETIGIEDKIVF